MSKNLVLISGESSSGKSMSLMGLENPEGVLYFNCEHKKLPFKSEFKEILITDPMQIFSYINGANKKDEYHTIVIDSVTFLLNLFENIYVKGSPNTQKAWGDYGTYFQDLMSKHIARSNKNVIVLAHTEKIINDDLITEVRVGLKGAVGKKEGVEAYFSTVISPKKILLTKLEDYKNDLLHITEEDELLGYKHVFQTRITKDTISERIRSPFNMWTQQETYIDSDVQIVMNKLQEYYED